MPPIRGSCNSAWRPRATSLRPVKGMIRSQRAEVAARAPLVSWLHPRCDPSRAIVEREPDPGLLLDHIAGESYAGDHRALGGALRNLTPPGTTIVIATHSLQEADTYAGRTTLLARGPAVADGSSTESRSRPRSFRGT